jgi:nucleoside-diphosphate-sugar epimerase
MREALQPTAPVFTFVDVRDVALAHVRALTVPKAGGNRFYVVAGYFSNKKIADIIRDSFPQLADRLPPKDVPDDFPENVYQFNNAKSKEVLGLEYMGLEKSVRDTAQSIFDSGLLDV